MFSKTKSENVSNSSISSKGKVLTFVNAFFEHLWAYKNFCVIANIHNGQTKLVSNYILRVMETQETLKTVIENRRRSLL